jgi:hypothetical protein
MTAGLECSERRQARNRSGMQGSSLTVAEVIDLRVQKLTYSDSPKISTHQRRSLGRYRLHVLMGIRS